MSTNPNDVIWDYFQTKGIESFEKDVPRYAYMSSIAMKHLPTKEAKLLNIGVGAGGLERTLINQGYTEVYSLDPSEKAVAGLKKMGSKGYVGTIETTPFEANTFDAVFAVELLEHLDEKILSAGLKEVERILKPGGYFIGSVPFEEKLSENEVICPSCAHVYHRWGHVRAFSKLQLAGRLDEAFGTRSAISVRAYVDWNRRGLINKAKSMGKWVLGLLGEQIAYPSLVFKIQKKQG